MVICTDQFLSLAKTISRVQGLPSLKIVVIPHPLGGQPREDVVAKAKAAFKEIVEALTRP